MATKKANIIALLVMALIGFMLLKQDSSPSQQQSIEEQLAATLAKIEGVGQVSVYLHTDASKESSLFSFSTADDTSTYTGVLIVSEGAGSPSVKRRLVQTVSSVLQLSPHRIVILPMEKGELHES